jgi:hypothetical protein
VNVNKVCFLSCCNNAYAHFVLPHVTSELLRVPSSVAEVFLEDVKTFEKEFGGGYALMKEIFGDRVLVRQVPEVGHPHLVRFVYESYLRAQFTYIGDIDILVLDSEMMTMHENHMNKYNIDYSNKKRQSEDNAFTGLHCVYTERYYPKTRIWREKMKIYNAYTYVENRRVSSSYDEMVLHDIVYESYSSDKRKNLPIRPIHGIHMSAHQSSPLWGVRKWELEYRQLAAMDIWMAISSHFGSKFKGIIKRLEDELEIRTRIFHL